MVITVKMSGFDIPFPNSPHPPFEVVLSVNLFQ